MKYFLLSLRPKQWIKNIIIFAALFFSQNFFDKIAFLKVLFGFFLFCLVCGCGYIINDILDRKYDALHPQKSKRPIVSGNLSIKSAMTGICILLPLSFILSFYLKKEFFLLLASYFLLTFSYSLYLKNIVLCDILVLSFGFVIRAISGAVLIGVEISSWLVVCTFLLALFLASCKRRAEVVNYLNTKYSLKFYDVKFLDGVISSIIGATIIAYCLYAFSERVSESLKTQAMPLSIPFVVFGLFRYYQLVTKENIGSSPEADIFKDKSFLINIILWIVCVFFIIYL